MHTQSPDVHSKRTNKNKVIRADFKTSSANAFEEWAVIKMKDGR